MEKKDNKKLNEVSGGAEMKIKFSKKIRISQVGSHIARPENQYKTLKALGLGKIGKTVEVVDNPSIRGMIFKVKHLVKVEEI